MFIRKCGALVVGAASLVACNDHIADDPTMGFGDDNDPSVDAADAGAGDDSDASITPSEDASSDAGHVDAGEQIDAAAAIPEGCMDRPQFGGAKGYPTFAVQSTDYSAASVALLDESGKLLDDRYVSSGSNIPGLERGLHGDIAIPTTPAEPTVLTVVARAKGDYVLRVDLQSGDVLGQIRTQSNPFDMDDPGAAYASNPHDYLYINDTTAFVSRFAPNLDPDAAAIDQGDDLLVIDPSTGERIERIGLEAWHETIEVDDTSGGRTEETVYARPSGMLGMGCHALVATARLTSGWKGTDGAIGVLDLREKRIVKVDLETLRNCDSVKPVADDARRAVVQCNGSPWGDPASAGLALVHLDEDGELNVEHTYLQQGDDMPKLSASTVSLGGTRVVSKASGDYGAGTGDTLYELDLATGETKALYTAGGPGTIGGGAYDPSRGLLYVPDAEAGVRIFEVNGAEIEEQDVLVIDDALPPRSIRALRAL